MRATNTVTAALGFLSTEAKTGAEEAPGTDPERHIRGVVGVLRSAPSCDARIAVGAADVGGRVRERSGRFYNKRLERSRDLTTPKVAGFAACAGECSQGSPVSRPDRFRSWH
jgi:hypothetical protein